MNESRPPLYILVCCETEIEIFTDRESQCPECHTRFVVTAALPEGETIPLFDRTEG